MDGRTTLSIGSSWYFGNSNGVFDKHARINICDTKNGWLITPSFTVPGGATVSFDLALTAKSGSNAPAPATSGYDDKFVVLIYTDDMDKWTILRQWDNAGSKYVYNDIKTKGEKVTIDLNNNYVGKSACIAFYGESTASDADNNLHIDNVCIGTTVDATEWQTVNTAEAAANLTDLTPATAYEWQVQSVKDNQESDWSSSATFTTFGGLELADDDSEKPNGEKNAYLISTDDGEGKDVMLVGRKLYKDNAWNTICLPFNVTIANSPLAGATVMKLTPSTSKLTNGTLTLNFEDENTTMTAGTPYIIKWASGDDIENPVFTGVTIDKSAEVQARRIVSFTGGQFVGTYSPVALPLNDQSNLFLGANNTLCWPNASNADPADDSYYINACRAYFHIGNNTAVREFRLNFGDNEAAGITTTNFMNLTNSSGAWYSLDGRKLNSKPTARGVYIHGGCKVVIK